MINSKFYVDIPKAPIRKGKRYKRTKAWDKMNYL